MPSFAKAAAVDPSNPLVGLWKDQPESAPLVDLLHSHRTRAAEILGTLMPAKIAHIRALLEGESDPSSPLWVGRVQEGDYKLPRMVQPDTLSALLSQTEGVRLEAADLKEGEGVVLPSEVTRAGLGLERGEGDDEDENLLVSQNEAPNGKGQAGSADVVVEKGVRVGQHWFEVVPRNRAQVECLELVTKEHEDLHMMVMDLRVWLELEIPLIEDGNSFGAEVQGHLIKELLTAYNKSNTFINTNRTHHTDRIKLASDWVRFPNVLDYPAAIAASDRFDHLLTRSYLRNQLMVYGGLLTKFQRNWDKVINPKKPGSGAAGGMY